MPGKIACQIMKKVRIPRKDQVLDLILKQKGRFLNKQGELQQNLVWSRKQQTVQNQEPEQAQKQDL